MCQPSEPGWSSYAARRPGLASTMGGSSGDQNVGESDVALMGAERRRAEGWTLGRSEGIAGIYQLSENRQS